MSRHAADRKAKSDGGRLKHFVEVEKTHGEEGSHPATKAVHERPVKRDDAARVRQFIRIERGRTA